MQNPWKDIPLSDYESHMSLDTVAQLQTLSAVMKHQFEAVDAESVMILGVAGGNGLEHIDRARYKKVFGVDVNSSYLEEVGNRYSSLDGVLELICADLTAEYDRLPQADLLIADLLIEYIGFECFGNVVKQVCPKYISCVTQYDTCEGFVSDSPYLHSFDGLDSIHRSIDPDKLKECLTALGYSGFHSERYPLPNGKMLIRTDCGSNDTAK